MSVRQWHQFFRTSIAFVSTFLVFINQVPPALSVPATKQPIPPASRLTIPPLPIEKPQYDQRGVPSSWKYLNEQEWIVDSIGRDIAEILNFAKSIEKQEASTTAKKGTAGAFSFKTQTLKLDYNKYSYQISSPFLEEPLTRDFTLVNFAWAPANYEPFAKELLKSFDLGSSNTSKAPDDFMRKLASADMCVILEENDRVSKALTKNPLDAGLHEQAALLQAVIGLIDFSGGFCDTRIPLQRICSHLAIAKVLNHNELNTVGTLADIALECLACRDGVAAQQSLALLGTTSDPTVQSWLRAIKIRATGDYRIFDDEKRTELEALQFGMRSGSNPSQSNVKYVKEHFLKIPVRWMRIISLGKRPYETHQLVLTKILAEEKSDFLRDYNFVNKANEVDITAVKKDLNLTPARCLQSRGDGSSLAAISWDDVAAYHCRHILWASMSELNLYENLLNNDYQASNFITQSYQQFSSLTLWPFLLRQTQLGRIAQPEFFGRVQQVFLHHPELVTKSNWQFTNSRAYAQVPDAKVIPAEKFFNPSMPFGTAYWYADRRTLANCAPTLDGLTELRHWAPCDAAISHDYAIKKYGPKPSSAQWTDAYGPLAEFNLEAMTDIAKANASTPDECIRSYEKLAALNPAAYFHLAEYCEVIGKTDDAVRFAEEGVAKCPDPVITSNCTVWLVRYYLSHDLKEKARALVARNYELHSRGSFLQASALNESMGRLETAAGLLEIDKQRYGDSGALCAFCIRNKDKEEKFAGVAKKLMLNFYPDGMKEVKTSDFRGNPQRGVRITADDWMEPRSPLRKNCVMVAVNGIPVEDKGQLALLTKLTDKNSATVIFWDGHEFAETEKKFGFSKDFNLHYTNFWGTRSLPTKKIGGQELPTGDRSLAAITPESFGANRCGTLGIRYDRSRCLTVVRPGMPASEAGLKVGDKILTVDKVPVSTMTDRQISNQIRGFIGTLVNFTVSRNGRDFSCIMKRRHPTTDEELAITD